MNKPLEIPVETYDRIVREIEMADSPVGIDAKKTHVLIIHQLETIASQLADLQRRVGALES